MAETTPTIPLSEQDFQVLLKTAEPYIAQLDAFIYQHGYHKFAELALGAPNSAADELELVRHIGLKLAEHVIERDQIVSGLLALAVLER